MKRLLASTLAASVVALTAFWPFGGEDALAEMSVRNQSGLVQILRGDEVIRVNGGDIEVRPGDVIRTHNGVANLRLEGDRQVWLSGATQASSLTRVASTSSLEGRAGTILAKAGDAMKVDFGTVTAVTEGAFFRIDQRAGGARAASLGGNVRLSAPGEPTMVVGRLFELPASAGDLRNTRPYQLNIDDPFDKRELAPLIELQQQLDQLTLGFANQLGKQKPDISYFRALADGTQIDPIKEYLKRPTIDLLTAFTIASNTDTPFATAIRKTFEYHDQGGSWAIVAALLRSSPRLVLADLTDIIVATGAVDQAPEFTIAAAEAADDGTLAGPGGGGNGDGSGGDGSGGDGGGGSGGGAGGGGGEEPKECTSGPDCDVQELRDRILGEPSPSPSDGLADGLDV